MGGSFFGGRRPGESCRRSDVGGLPLGVEDLRPSTVVGLVEERKECGIVYWIEGVGPGLARMEGERPGLGCMDAVVRHIDRGLVAVPAVVAVVGPVGAALFVVVGFVVPFVPS